MNGAESLVHTLADSGIEVCFSNPGTSEMHFVASLDSVPRLRPILTLFEGVATGAADGYARMMGRPAATLLHLGPGLANGLANLHNARRAAVPLVNIVGDHATHHATYDAPLTSNIVDFARPVSGWIRTCTSAASVATDAARAVQAARSVPGQIATLILPADTAWNEAEGPAQALSVSLPSQVSEAALDRAAAVLQAVGGSRVAILMRGAPLYDPWALAAAARISAAAECRLLCDTFAPRLDRGASQVEVERIPYFAEEIVAFLQDLDCLVLVGARPPVAFFAYPGKASWCLPERCHIVHLAHDSEDGVDALLRLAERLLVHRADVPKSKLAEPTALTERPRGTLDAGNVGRVIAQLLPEGAILSDDGTTSSGGTLVATRGAAPHSHLALTGGALGQGLPVAIGAAVACPDRKVVCLSGDGSGLYTLQALWTMAREKLDVTTVVFVNRSYKILNIELGRVGVSQPGPKALSMLDLANPSIEWSLLARGLGVEATRIDTLDDFFLHFADAMRMRGPRLLEIIL